jgi:predicted Fe-Mo cluster-binding NifX family protein
MLLAESVRIEGDLRMKLALTVWENRISPVFDCAQRLLVVDVHGEMATGKHLEPFRYESPFSRATKLSDLGIKVLICGAVSESFANVIETYGIRIIPFVAGAVEEVLDAFLTGQIYDAKFRMPGCGSKSGRSSGTE